MAMSLDMSIIVKKMLQYENNIYQFGTAVSWQVKMLNLYAAQIRFHV